MENAKVTVKGNKLIIEVDLTQDLGLTQKGKHNIIAKSSGVFETIAGTRLQANLMMIRPINTDAIGNPIEAPAAADSAKAK